MIIIKVFQNMFIVIKLFIGMAGCISKQIQDQQLLIFIITYTYSYMYVYTNNKIYYQLFDPPPKVCCGTTPIYLQLQIIAKCITCFFKSLFFIYSEFRCKQSFVRLSDVDVFAVHRYAVGSAGVHSKLLSSSLFFSFSILILNAVMKLQQQCYPTVQQFRTPPLATSIAIN